MALFGTKKNTTKKDITEKDAVKFAKSVAKKKTTKPEVKEEAASSMKDLYGDGEGAEKVVKDKAGKKTTSTYSASYRVLVKPLITEKATNLVSENKYAFIVALSANKIEVAQAIEATYGVKALSVNMINVKGKKVSRGRISGKRKDYKKAIVTLKKGETIKLYEGV